MGNDLCVISNACFGLHVIKPIIIAKPTPAFVIIAPDAAVSSGFLEDKIAFFYQDLLEAGNLSDAYEHHLASEFKYYHCDRLLLVALAKYINKYCKGTGLRLRKEHLLTEAIAAGLPRTPANLKAARRLMKRMLHPDQTLIDTYAQ